MKNYHRIFFIKILYILFIILSLNIFFFSTTKVIGKSFEISNISISRPFEINFNKNDVIDEGFRVSYKQLLSLILNSSDQKKINQVKLNEIKGMIESFTIQEEKFIDETYHVNLGVSFNRKKVFSFLEKKNIFPSIPKTKKFLFIPIMIDEDSKNLLLFYNNEFYKRWNSKKSNSHLIQYVLPTEDIEDVNLLKDKFDTIEKYDFKSVISKYDLEDFIIALIFKNEKELRILSKINLNDNVILKNQTFTDFDLNSLDEVDNIIQTLKVIYEDHWKNINQINTSIKLTLNIKASNSDSTKISRFEKVLEEIDLVYDFAILKLNKDFVYYQIIFNGAPNIFLKKMDKLNFNFDTQNQIWILQ